MLLGECIKKTQMIIDEYSSGGTVSSDRDIMLRIKDLCDIGQKQLAQIKKIARHCGLSKGADGVFSMPDDFYKLRRTRVNGKINNNIGLWEGARLYLSKDIEPGSVSVEYFAFPKTITAETPDEYELELEPDAAECLPYFAAAQILLVDIVTDASPVMNMYDRLVARLDTRLPGSVTVREAL